MPYIITHGFRMDTGHIDAITRTASSDLIAARAAVQQVISDNDPNYDADMLNAVDALPTDGGTVPLPDGTVIEVQRVSWPYLHVRSGTGVNTHAAILAAYNAAR